MAKDDYVVNDQGHTSYPKWVENKEGKQVIVQTPEEEAEVIGKKGKGGWKDNDPK